MGRDDKAIKAMARLVDRLEEWARWYESYNLKLAMPSKAAVCESHGKSAYSAWEDFEQEVDQAVFVIIDAAVDDLPPAQGNAVRKRYGLCSVWRWPRNNYEECLLAAHERLLKELPARGVVI